MVSRQPITGFGHITSIENLAEHRRNGSEPWRSQELKPQSQNFKDTEAPKRNSMFKKIRNSLSFIKRDYKSGKSHKRLNSGNRFSMGGLVDELAETILSQLGIESVIKRDRKMEEFCLNKLLKSIPLVEQYNSGDIFNILSLLQNQIKLESEKSEPKYEDVVMSHAEIVRKILLKILRQYSGLFISSQELRSIVTHTLAECSFWRSMALYHSKYLEMAKIKGYTPIESTDMETSDILGSMVFTGESLSLRKAFSIWKNATQFEQKF